MKHRQLRVNELVKRELSGIIAREMNFDAALVSILGADNRDNVIDKLEACRPALQAELSRHVILKYTPHLIFHLDESIKRGARVLEILNDLDKPDGQEK
jgi:ribosome-binding factor A